MIRPWLTDAAITNQKFDFLGYTLRPRLSRRWRDTFGIVFGPAASDKALKTIRQMVPSWTLHERSDKSLDDLARMFNSDIRGGLTTTAGTTSRLSTRPCDTSTVFWRDGRIGTGYCTPQLWEIGRAHV